MAIATFRTVGASTRAAPWHPTTSAILGGQASSGSNLMGCSVSLAVKSYPIIPTYSGRVCHWKCLFAIDQDSRGGSNPAPIV